MMNDICCIGHITHDRVITPAQTVEMAGGTSFYFAWAMSQLPQKTDYLLVTKVGDESMDEIECLRRAIGMSYADAGRMAAAMCTLKLEHSGPFDRSMADIERLLRR